MARRFRQLVSQLWQRELGVRRGRADAAAHRQHQRPADQGWRAQISLAARPASQRSPITERSRPLREKATSVEDGGHRSMPADMIDHKSESHSIDAPATGKADAAADRDAKSPQTDAASKPVPPGGQRSTRRRRLLVAVLGVLVAAALWFGIPYVLLSLSTVSTDDAFVNGHVTFVAARVHGQVSRVLVDDNNRVHKGDLLVQLDKEP